MNYIMGLKKANDGKHLGSTPKLYITASRVLTQSKCDKKNQREAQVFKCQQLSFKLQK